LEIHLTSAEGQTSAVQLPNLTAVQIGMTASKSRRGGLDRYFFGLTTALPDQGIDVQGLVVGDKTELDPTERATCIEPDDTPLISRWKAMRRAISGPLATSDLVVSHFAPYVFPVLDKIRGRPLVVHFHGPWALEGATEGAGVASSLAKRAIEWLVYARGSRFVVLSRAFATILEHKYGVAGEKIRVVPGGVDLDRFRTTGARRAAKELLGWPTDRPTVLSVRRLVHAKGLENFISAIKTVSRRVPDVLAVIAGTGPLKTELKHRVAQAGLEKSVRFAGFVPEELLPTMYRAADLFVVPTIALEGFGLVVIEALACGTPVLVTPIAGLPEVIADLDPGLIVGGSTADHLAQGIGDALTGRLPLPSDADCISYANRFGWPRIAERVAQVYREVV
jgi:glycosyltransferase involved in cell wall biosynthesis